MIAPHDADNRHGGVCLNPTIPTVGYQGTRPVYPGALCLLSALLPEDFPSHRNGRMDCTHLAFWEPFPTIPNRGQTRHPL